MSRTQILDPGSTDTFKYVITHVFCPLKLPDGNDHTIRNDDALAGAVATAARLYSRRVDQANFLRWHCICRMLENLQAIVQWEIIDRSQVVSQFCNMAVGDVLALFIRAQNAGVIFRKQEDVTIFESFEISLMAKYVMATQGKLICSYPGPAIEIPSRMFNDRDFLSELVNFLFHMNHDSLPEMAEMSQEEQSPVLPRYISDSHSVIAETSREEQPPAFNDTVHPRYITELLTGILRGVGRPADIARISKRVGDDVVCNDLKLLPWRRSSLWLLIRVALQTTLDRSPGHHTYKEFMLFFLCFLAEEETCADLPSDLLHFMLAKITRRLQKLGSSSPDWLSHTVLETCTSLRSIIDDRWIQVQATQRLSPAWNPFQLDLARDIHLSLLGSRKYLCNSPANHSTSPANIPFNPKHHPRGILDDFLSSDGSFFEEAYHIEPRVTLYDVEQAVERDIDAWVERVTDNDEACVKLEVLMNKYSSSALRTYRNNPELLSVMLLTTMELWVALDKIAIKEIPMLADYSPEVPASLLENLLLRKSANLHRLRRAHECLSLRHSQSRNQWSVFSSTITADSFAIRFYRKSSHLQRLKDRIEEVPRRQVREKLTELREMNARYARLRIRDAVTFSSSHQMDTLIRVHQWPLPANRLENELVIFELDCPISFNMWRAATFHLLFDISPTSEVPLQQLGGGFIFRLNDYDALRPYFSKHPRSQITLGSYSRQPVPSHVTMPIPAKREEVCLNDWFPNFFLFDTCTGFPVSQALGHSDSTRTYCKYTLPSGLYNNLQKYVTFTSHTSNEVIANQADCHRDLSIQEYISFGHLRSGGSLQWLNILRVLRDRSLSFRRHEVHVLLAQAVSQVGPLVNTDWTWHQEIQDPAFCYSLLGELQSLIRDVQVNWTEGMTMDTISLLLRRLLASSPDEAISREALGLLRTVRSKVFSWIQELSLELVEGSGDDRYHGILRDTAAICRSTFDVDSAIIQKALHSAEDIEVLLFSAILMHDHMPNDVSRLSAYSQLLLDRDSRLSLSLENAVRDVILADSGDQGINLAVRRVWSDYYPGSKWLPLQFPNSRWFSCTTAPPTDQRPQTVHYNILDGSLLINGKPLGIWLPHEYVRRSIYKLIFGEQVLKVSASDLPGMNFLTRDLISDHQVYFSLRNDSDLVIRAKREQMVTGGSEIIELIPQKVLHGDLPAVLIEGHAHWLNISTSVMEIRPLDTLWETSSENWRVDCTPGRYRMWKGHDFLVDIRSQSWDMISSLLRPLSPPQDLIVSVSPADPSRPTSSLQLSVVLPRYDLSFYIDEDGDLRSRNFRDMVYDKNQSIGTLFGLVNRLVLRKKIRDINAVELTPRCVLIPDGDISFRIDGSHVRVEVAPRRPVLKQATYYTYGVNTDLGCLTGNGSLTSKLYCAYLHALTSGFSIDPLTGRSGSEEALSMLRSASFCAISGCGSYDAELLSLIASICPSSTWCPGQSMQKVEWCNLPSNSHAYELFILANAIVERHESVQLLHKHRLNPLSPDFPSQDDHLFKRNAQRAVYLSAPELSKQHSVTKFDVRYPARDLVEAASREHRAYTAATYVCHRTATTTIDMWTTMRSWGEDVVGDTALSLQYDRSWLAPDPPLIWLKAYNLLRESNERKWFQLLFSLPAMAYASPDFSELVPVLVSFASHPQFRFEDPPYYDSYPIWVGYCPSLDTLRNYIINSGNQWNSTVRQDASAIAQRLLDAWPCETPPLLHLVNPEVYDVTLLTSKIQRIWSDCFRNFKLKEHVTNVQLILNARHSVKASPLPDTPYSFHPSQSTPYCIPWKLTLDQLFGRPAPPLRTRDKLHRFTAKVGNTPPLDSTALHQLITTVGTHAGNPFQSRYISALCTSAECFTSDMSRSSPAPELPAVETLLEYYAGCRASYVEALYLFRRNLGPSHQSEHAVAQSGQWPRITAHTLFRCLASNSSIALPNDWKRCLTVFALLALELQRARRLVLLHLDNHHEELWMELQNEGCDGWDAETHPDWLLIQLEGNFLIRRVQAEVANEMISPRSSDNTAMQLNMGEGKTSVIVPIVAATLANGDQLVRVIVPKPLTVQTLHVLADRLGGLTSRRIYYLPFSRSLEVSHEAVASLRQIMLECMEERGILVLQPEHALSLKLVGVEKQLSQAEDSQLASPLLELQMWLYSHSRDILDECDEILDVRSQLVYTIGLHQPVEGSPERWTTTQQVLNLVSKRASFLHDLFPHGVELEPGPPGSFSYLRILQAEAGDRLISWIVHDVVDGLLPNISFGHLPLHSGILDAIQSFISCEDVSPAKVVLVRESCQKTLLWGGLLLLRGLLAHGILLFALRERRWRVDYGLSPMRSMLAVPFRAKDVPAQRAEFGHPDVAIILTCLSHYYGGLNEEQLKLSFEILSRQHDPCLDYDIWIRACPAVPESLRTFSGVNTKSVEQWNMLLFPLFSRNRETVNFYLSNVVFPKEAKEFLYKLSSSGWDLAEKKKRPLTGFSGTNDGQYLLPLHVTQRDPDHQRGTNAKVLSYLLLPENNYYACMAHKNGERQSTREFLQILVSQKPEIRILLDVGAQMLDLQNHELAIAWLDSTPNACAAIYFNEDDELMVGTRGGNVQLLRSSPFEQQLDQCVIYLDDAHTRGTDIKFPSGFRAAVTLGPKVTKDRLTQGCMRLRKLGHGHSVMFFAPLEVDRCIRAVANKAPSDVIDTRDILHWAIRETWEGIQRWAPHWVQQGMDHISRYSAWASFCAGKMTSKKLSDKWLQPEAKRLEDLYILHNNPPSAILNRPDIRQRSIDLGVLSLLSVGLDEEQERELVYEFIREQQVERPPRAQPANHSIHRDVVSFVKTGVIPRRAIFFRTRDKTFSPVFDTLHATSAANHEAYVWSQSVLATKDFEETVKVPGMMDDYLRPVHWIVSAKGGTSDVLVILSPYEVSELLPDIRSSDKVHLHLYTPRITKSMKPCDDLALYSIPAVPTGWTPPSSFMDELNVFAGQLYMKDYGTYTRVCRLLCMYTRDLEGGEAGGFEVEPDGFILPRNRAKHPRVQIAHTFSSTPIVAIRALVDLRGKGIDYASTHMGKLLHGRLLSEDDFDD